MMKHLFSFLIIASLLLFGCRSKTQSNFQPELLNKRRKAILYLKNTLKKWLLQARCWTGIFILMKKIWLLLFLFLEKWRISTVHLSKRMDHSLSVFLIFAKIREISIRNYAEHLYVHPGDSVYVEIDFKDMFHPK